MRKCIPKENELSAISQLVNVDFSGFERTAEDAQCFVTCIPLYSFCKECGMYDVMSAHDCVFVFALKNI